MDVLYKLCLRLVQQNYRSEFERLLENANEKLVYQKRIEFLLIEVYKYLNGVSPDIMNTIFKACVRYFLSNFLFFLQMIALQKL